MTTAKELHQELAQLTAAMKQASCGLEKVSLFIKLCEFDKRWKSHWAEVDRAAADLPPSMRID